MLLKFYLLCVVSVVLSSLPYTFLFSVQRRVRKVICAIKILLIVRCISGALKLALYFLVLCTAACA